MATFDHLPQEICSMIVFYVPGKPSAYRLYGEDLQNLKNLRLTCKAFQPECERLLFECLTVWPQRLNLERLVNIASASHLRHHVNHLLFEHSTLPDTPLSLKHFQYCLLHNGMDSKVNIEEYQLRYWKESTAVIEEYVKDTKDGYLIDLLTRALHGFSELISIDMSTDICRAWGIAAIRERTLLVFDQNSEYRSCDPDKSHGNAQLKLLIHAGQRLKGLPCYHLYMDVEECCGGLFSLNSDDLNAARIAFRTIEVLYFSISCPLLSAGDDEDDEDEELQNIAISQFLGTMENVNNLFLHLIICGVSDFQMLNNFVGFKKLEDLVLALDPDYGELDEDEIVRFFTAYSATLTQVTFRDFSFNMGALQNLFPRLREVLQLSSCKFMGKCPYYEYIVDQRTRWEISKELIKAIGQYMTRRTDTLPAMPEATTSRTSLEEGPNI